MGHTYRATFFPGDSCSSRCPCPPCPCLGPWMAASSHLQQISQCSTGQWMWFICLNHMPRHTVVNKTSQALKSPKNLLMWTVLVQIFDTLSSNEPACLGCCKQRKFIFFVCFCNPTHQYSVVENMWGQGGWPPTLHQPAPPIFYPTKESAYVYSWPSFMNVLKPNDLARAKFAWKHWKSRKIGAEGTKDHFCYSQHIHPHQISSTQKKWFFMDWYLGQLFSER